MVHYLLGNIFAVNTFIIDSIALSRNLPDAYHISILLLNALDEEREKYLKSLVEEGILKVEICYGKELDTIVEQRRRGMSFEDSDNLFIAKREKLTLIHTDALVVDEAHRRGIPHKYPDRWDHDSIVLGLLHLL